MNANTITQLDLPSGYTKEYHKTYRLLRKSAGWMPLTRYLPPDLFKQVCQLIANHKHNNSDVWASVPTPHKQVKG
jgi:hypothetical protein